MLFLNESFGSYARNNYIVSYIFNSTNCTPQSPHASSPPYCPPPPPHSLLQLLCISFSAALTSPHLNLIEFVCAANGSPNDTLIPPVKGDECLHALAAQSMLVIIFLIWWIPPHPALTGNEIISHFDN